LNAQQSTIGRRLGNLLITNRDDTAHPNVATLPRAGE